MDRIEKPRGQGRPFTTPAAVRQGLALAASLALIGLSACAPKGILNSAGTFSPNPHHALPTYARSQEQRPDRWVVLDEEGSSICDLKFSSDLELAGSSCYDSTSKVRKTFTRTFDTAGVYVFARGSITIETDAGGKRSERNHIVSFFDKQARCIVRERYSSANRLRSRDREFLDDSLRIRKSIGPADEADSATYAYAGFLPLRKTCWKRGKVDRIETYVYADQPKIERIEVCFTDMPSCGHRRETWYKYGE